MRSAAVYVVQLASGAPGGASGSSRGHLWGLSDEKGVIFDHLGALLVPKMSFLSSESQPICFKFEIDALKIRDFESPLD